VTVPLTGEQYAISAGPYRATVTELGAGLRELVFRDEPVLAGYEADELPPAGAGQLLAPWPNRVNGGRYAFGGTEFQLALTEPPLGNAIHGLTRWTAWTAVSHDAGSVLLRSSPHGWQGYPFCLEIEAGFRLHPDRGLAVAITARNHGHGPAPYGTGFHPYLTVGTASVDDCELSLPASSWLPVDDRGIPSGPLATVEGTQYDFRQPRAIGTTRLDTPLTGLDRDESGRAWAHLAAAGGTGARVSLWAGEGYRWLQVFTGDPLGPDRRRKALAVEPMTCPPNAFVTGDDLLVLQPGETVTHTWGIQAWLPGSAQLVALTGEDGCDEGGVGVTAAVQVADHGIDVEGHGMVFGDHVCLPPVLQQQPVGLSGRPGHPGAAGVEGADAADQTVDLKVGVTAHDHVGAASGQQATELLLGGVGVDTGAVVALW
jgi:aldose 1-epimerase